MLTAYGLQEFGDMSRVHDVDPALIKRTAEWLLSQQQADGSWAGRPGISREHPDQPDRPPARHGLYCVEPGRQSVWARMAGCSAGWTTCGNLMGRPAIRMCWA